MLSCNQKSELAEKERELIIVKDENVNLKKELIAIDSLKTQNEMKQTGEYEGEEAVQYMCSPKKNYPKILSGPDVKLTHPDWKDNEVVTSWQIMVSKKITKAKIVFLVGDLISPTGKVVADGPYYVIHSEWRCFND